MAVPRPVLLALVGAFLVLGAFLFTRAAGDRAADGEPAAAPAEAPKRANAEPERRSARPERRSAAKPAPARAAEIPLPVVRAMRRKDTVVLFFSQTGASDDAATRDSVRELERAAARGPLRGKVAVFPDRLSDLGDYGRLVEGLGISQAPTVVILPPDLDAQVVEGYVDAGSLIQRVKDARR